MISSLSTDAGAAHNFGGLLDAQEHMFGQKMVFTDPKKLRF